MHLRVAWNLKHTEFRDEYEDAASDPYD